MSLALNPFRELSVEIDGVTTLVEAIMLEVKINDVLMLFVLIDGTVRGPLVMNEFVVSVFVVIEFVLRAFVEIPKAFMFPAFILTELIVDTLRLLITKSFI